MKRMNSRTNNETIAIAKAIGIMFVVLWHANPPIWIGKFIMFFCVPLFFFTSGYFFKPKENIKDLFYYILKRIKKLYIPFISWSILFLFLHNFFSDIYLYNEYYNTQNIIQKLLGITTKLAYQDELLGPLWFVSVLFYISIIIGTISYICKKTNFYYPLFILFFMLIIAVSSKYYIHFNHYLQQTAMYSFALSFFLSGYLLKKYNINFTNNKIIIGCLIILLIASFSYDRVVEMVNYTYYDVIPYFIIANAGIIVTLFSSHLLQQIKIKHFFVYIGYRTLIILTLHIISFRLVSALKIYLYHMDIHHLSDHPVIIEYNHYFYLLYFVSGIIIPLSLYYLYETIKEKIKLLF